MAGYTLPDGVTLKNKLAATSHEMLERGESARVQRRSTEILLGKKKIDVGDPSVLKHLHHHLFQDVFEWSGHTRDEPVRLSDGSIAHEPVMRKIDGKSFSTGNQIAHELQAFNTALTSSNNLTGLSRADFAKEASALFGLLNSIHPFREGNGRVQRLFFQLLAKEAGHPLNFAGVTKERMTLASISSHEKGDNSMFERLFLEISDQSRGLLLEDGLMRLIQAYDKHGTRFDPNEIYMTTFTPGETKTVQFVGVSGNQFAARTQNQIFFGLAVNLPKPIPKPGQKFTFHEPSLGDGDSDDTPNGSSGRGKITPHKPSGRGGYGD